MVRMSQAFTLRVPMIDGHGNFGSLDDGPAASRYTETRLAAAALIMNEGLDEDVVDFKPNYDAQLSEPEVLPAAFPNLLVNGSSGIAVGMATNMAPHNMREVIAGAIHLLSNPKATSADLMKFIPGPDLPSGGIIMGTEGITEAYETGRGSFKTRAKVSIESVSPRKLALVVTELPYLVGPERIIEKIKDGVNSKKLQGISDVIDLTDRTNGLKLVIELKTGFDPNVVLDLLYRFTPLEDSFSINNVALVDGRPETLGLRDMLGVYLAHRVVVIKRRTENRLGKKLARLHLVEGLLKAILSIDEVIKIIRAADEVDDARKKLMSKFTLSEIQAEYILELKLRRLTKFSKLELENEGKTLAKEIADLKKILSADKNLRDVVAAELEEVSAKYGDDRRSTISDGITEVKPVSSAKAAAIDAQLADSPCFIVLTASGQVLRTTLEPVARSCR
jgi:DNA gyrase subunit A